MRTNSQLICIIAIALLLTQTGIAQGEDNTNANTPDKSCPFSDNPSPKDGGDAAKTPGSGQTPTPTELKKSPSSLPSDSNSNHSSILSPVGSLDAGVLDAMTNQFKDCRNAFIEKFNKTPESAREKKRAIRDYYISLRLSIIDEEYRQFESSYLGRGKAADALASAAPVATVGGAVALTPIGRAISLVGSGITFFIKAADDTLTQARDGLKMSEVIANMRKAREKARAPIVAGLAKGTDVYTISLADADLSTLEEAGTNGAALAEVQNLKSPEQAETRLAKTQREFDEAVKVELPPTIKATKNGITGSIRLTNIGTKGIAGFKGSIVFSDIFGEQLKETPITFDDGIPAGKPQVIPFSITLKKGDEGDKKFSSYAVNKMRAKIRTDVVIYE